MKGKNLALHLVFTILATAFLSACASWQTEGGYSPATNYSGGHGGHH